jgi:hypothetical protein
MWDDLLAILNEDVREFIRFIVTDAERVELR